MKVPEPEPSRHALVIAVQDYDKELKPRSKRLQHVKFGPLETTSNDAKMMEQVGVTMGSAHVYPQSLNMYKQEHSSNTVRTRRLQELESLEFNVSRKENLSAQGILTSVERFVYGACARQESLEDEQHSTGNYNQVRLATIISFNSAAEPLYVGNLHIETIVSQVYLLEMLAAHIPARHLRVFKLPCF